MENSNAGGHAYVQIHADGCISSSMLLVAFLWALAIALFQPVTAISCCLRPNYSSPLKIKFRSWRSDSSLQCWIAGVKSTVEEPSTGMIRRRLVSASSAL